MTPPSLPDILARLAAATPGPWYRMVTYSPDGAEVPTRTVLTAAPSHDDYKAFIADAYREADADLITHAPADLAALAARVAELEAENADLRVRLTDPRLVRTLSQIRQTEDEAVDFIDASPYRADIVARLSELSDGQPRPFDGGIDRTLLRLGLDCGGPDTIVANPSAFRVLARLTVSTEATP
jgi:hypothetical protein